MLSVSRTRAVSNRPTQPLRPVVRKVLFRPALLSAIPNHCPPTAAPFVMPPTSARALFLLLRDGVACVRMACLALLWSLVLLTCSRFPSPCAGPLLTFQASSLKAKLEDALAVEYGFITTTDNLHGAVETVVFDPRPAACPPLWWNALDRPGFAKFSTGL